MIFVRCRPFTLHDSPKRLAHVPAASKLHLYRVDTFRRASIVSSSVSAAKPAVGNTSKPRPRHIACSLHRPSQLGSAGRPIVRPDVEVRQHSFEQSRDARADGMTI